MAEVIVWFLFALGIITVIGHAIWWTLAMIFRAVFGDSPEPAKPVSLGKECVECGASLKLGDEFCHVCGRSQKPAAKPDPLADLAMTSRQMDSFLNLGKIDPATHQTVMAAIEEERERLLQPEQAQPKVEPVIESPAPTPVINSGQAAEPSREPRRSFAEMLETFMEESSIRWGEIIGGLLIIGCSLALVISLWAQITAVPLLKFSVFVGVTAGLFGIGFYSAFRWRLPTTSRGALTISTLLVPLNFLAMTAFSQTAEPNSPIIFAGELIALTLFMFLVYQAAKVIAPGKSVVSNSWLMVGVTLLPSAAMLMAKHWQSRQAAMVWLGVAPMVCYWLGTGAALRGARAETGEGFEHKSNRVFLIFGVATFAAVLPCALFLAKAGVFSITLRAFAPFITLFAVPAIACGMVFRQSAEASGKTKTVATSIALFGVMLAMSGLALTWPRPLPMIGAALINCAICAVIARSFDLKLAHAAALAFFVLAYLLGASVLFGGLPDWILDDNSRLIASFWTRSTGFGWLTLFVLFIGSAELWRRIGRKPERYIHEIAAIVSAFFSLLLLSLHGFGRAGDPQQLTLVYLFFAASAFAIAWFRDQFVAGWIGLALTQLAIVQAFAFRFGYQLAPYHPIRFSLLVFASLATATALAFRNSGGKVRRIFETPATFAALIASVAVAPFVMFGGWMSVGQLTGRVFWLAAIWLALSLMNNWRTLFTAFQAALTVGVVCGVLAIFDAHALPSALVWENPVLWQAVGIALALLSLCWIAVRLAVRRVGKTVDEPSNFERLLFPPWPTVDRMVTPIVWLLLIVLVFADKAYGLGSWLLLLALLLVFAVSLWEQFQRRLVLAMMTLLACACVLLAGRFEAEGLTVEWLRWSAAIGFALVVLPIIFRDGLRRFCEQFNWPQFETRSAGLAKMARLESLSIFAFPALVLTAEKFVWALSWRSMLLFLTPALIVSLTLAAQAIRERSAGYAVASGVLTTGLMFAFHGQPLEIRLLMATAAFAAPVGLALFAHRKQDQRLITACVRLGLLNLVMWGWAWLTPPSEAGSWQFTNRFIIVMLVAEAVLIGYRLVVMRRLEVESLWRKSLRADLPVVAGFGLIALAFVLIAEFEQRTSFGEVLLGWPAIVAVLVTLIGVSLSGIAFAVLPGEDPFDLDERGKMRYVYLSEAFVVLTFMHLRLTMPWLFGGVFSAYWPIVVMMLAFAGVALSEVFRRQGKLVLAEPLGKTGVLLPLLPVIGFWSLNSQVPYSGLLLTVGLFYGVLSVMKRSLGFGLLAALAGNSALWHFLNRVDGLAFFEHPQLWLIPAAVSALLAARINRESLTDDQMNSIRYGALVTIYVSSTADIFINGVDDAPWLPIILAVLAVAGVVAGLMLRIRAFLFLGTGFLLLSMLTMIWSASVNLQWTWLWYVTGIGFGVLIIYTFAMFERKREQMIGFVERLKQWQ